MDSPPISLTFGIEGAEQFISLDWLEVCEFDPEMVLVKP
jgi:hypothetical protein